MKYLRQFAVILTMTFFGEVLHLLLPLPVPASIYGMVLMLVSLMTGIVKLEQVRETGTFLIEIMPIMFIPAGVGLLDSWSSLRPILLPVFVVTAVSTIVVMGVSGKVTQFVIRKERQR